MDLNQKLQHLLQLINEGIRRKLYYRRYFELILFTFYDLINYRILKIESYKRFIKATIEPIWNELFKNKDLRDKLENFLDENPEINKYIERTNMHYSIIITDLDYQFEFLDKFENYGAEKIEEPIIKYIKELEDEIEELIKFKRLLKKEIDKIKSCFICENKCLNVCNKCGKCICESHSLSGFCPKCVETILEEKGKKT
jgi:hypothetical protein